MKQMISVTLSILILVGIGGILYDRLSPSMKRSSAEEVPLRVSTVEEDPNAANMLPPEARGLAHPHINSERIAALESDPNYKGPSVSVDYEKRRQEAIASNRGHNERLPASDEAPATPEAKKNKKSKK